MGKQDGSNRGWTLALTSVAFFMVALDALVVTTALPVMGRDLHAGMPALQWTVNAYGLAYAAGIITAAAQRFGGVLGVAVATTVFTAGGRLGTAATFTAGFRPALAIAAGLSLLGVLTALTLRRAPRRLEQTARQPATVPVPDPA